MQNQEGEQVPSQESGAPSPAPPQSQSQQPQQPPPPPRQQSPDQASPASSDSPFLELVRERYGVDLTRKYKNDEQALHGLLNAYSLVGRRDEDAEYGRRYREHEREFNDWLRSRAEESSKQQAAAPDPLWDAPEFHHEWLQYLVEKSDPETGRTYHDFLPNTPHSIRQGIEKALAYRQTFAQRLFQNPRQVIEPFVSRIVEEKIQSALSGGLRQYDAQQTASRIHEQNSTWLYERDSSGGLVVDGTTGRPMLTPAGRAYFNHISQYSRFINDPVELDLLAKRLVLSDSALMSQGGGGGPTDGAQANSAEAAADQAVPENLPGIRRAPRLPPGGAHSPSANAGRGAVGPTKPELKGKLSERIRQLGIMAARGQ